MKLYGGIDLHSNNSYVVLVNEQAQVVYQKRLRNDMALLLQELAPYREELTGLVIESTYNWYWQVDGLQAAGYVVHLANPSAIQPYSGLKHTDDKTDARWLAQLLRLGLLAEGHIYPKEQRGLREVLRRRFILVRQQTMTLLGIQGLFARYENIRLTGAKIKSFVAEEKHWLDDLQDKQVRQAATSQLVILRSLMEQIQQLEQVILAQLKPERSYQLLQTIPGIGPILAMAIHLETGDIRRFAKVGRYSSYCRCASSERVSNAKKKGVNNRKNGNVHLGWAFMEASINAIRCYPEIKAYYQKKLSKTHRVVALKAVANKLSRATYYVLKNQEEFEMGKAFS